MNLPVLPRVPFYLVRHGESEGNKARIICGFVDSPLSAKGRAQAQELCEAAKAGLSPRPDIMVHSALSRARDTGLALNQALGLPVRQHAGLNERNYGLWGGTPIEGMYEKIDADDIVPPQGESMPAFVARIFTTLDDVLTYGGCPVLVGHGGVFDAFLCGYGFEPIHVKNCQLYRFDPFDSATFPWRAYAYELADGKLTPTLVSAKLEPRKPHLLCAG